MRVDIVSIFPEMFEAVKCCGSVRRAIECKAIELRLWNPRDSTDDNYRRVDDRPYGGGPGMVMLAEPLTKTLQRLRDDGAEGRVIHLTPQGTRLEQDRIRDLANLSGLVLLTGRYEGIDERLIEQLVRYLPGVLGNDKSVMAESFSEGLLDWPHYTRPEQFSGQAVPSVLLGGNHEAIRRWRLQQALGRTWERRPDLMERLVLNEEQHELLASYQREQIDEEILS